MGDTKYQHKYSLIGIIFEKDLQHVLGHYLANRSIQAAFYAWKLIFGIKPWTNRMPNVFNATRFK